MDTRAQTPRLAGEKTRAGQDVDTLGNTCAIAYEQPPTTVSKVNHTIEEGSPEPSTTTTSSRPVLRTDRKLTDVGHSYADSIRVAKACVEEWREIWRQMRDGTAVMIEDMLDDVDSEHGQFACLCHEGVMKDFPDTFNKTDDFAATLASLNVHDYLQRDADALFESAFLFLQSDVIRDPCSPG